MTRTLALLFILPLALAGCAQGGTSGREVTVASAALVDAKGVAAGTARVVQQGKGLTLKVEASGLTPGAHGLHFHTIGLCEAPGFTTAGAHLNPLGRQHGTENPAGSHMGDLPNLVAGADGKASTQVPLGLAALGFAQAMLDADGAAIVIHAGPDDYRTDPTGNSGARVACGVFKR
jgi:Cu-Zn family superoxide dismutase